MATRAAIVGVGLTESTSPSRQTRSKAELCAAAVAGALTHAGLLADRVDAVVYGSLDSFEGSNLPAGALGGLLGLPDGVPIFHVNTGGSTGGNLVNVARLLVNSGDYEAVVCIGPSSFDSAADLQAVINTGSPLVIERPLGIGAIHMGAMYATAYADRFGATDEDFALIAVKNYANARHNPFAHLRADLTLDDVLRSPWVTTPLRLRTTCPVSSGATAVVLASERLARSAANPPVWVLASGSSSDTYLGGGRHDFARFENLAILADRVFRAAGLHDPAAELDLLELFTPYAPFELLELEALRIAGPGGAVHLVRRGATALSGEIPVNSSGGVMCTNPGVAAQLGPYAYAALQLMGQAAGGRQVPQARTAAAHSAGGNFFQFHTLAVLQRD